MTKLPNTSEEIIVAESKVLAALVQGSDEGSIRRSARASLGQYRWRSPAHQIIFEVLMAIPSEDMDTIRSQLPGRLTRMGFPDLDWEFLFAMPRLSQLEAQRLIGSLAR